MKSLQFIFLFICLSLGFSASSQEIKEYKAADNFYLVGDRVFSAYYITETSVIVFDPINDKISSATMKFIKKRTKLPVKHVFYSHNHWDHISGGKIFKDQGAVFHAHQKANENIEKNDAVVRVDSVWNGNKKEMVIGGKTLELYHFEGKNHGDGMTVFGIPEHNALFVIDLVVPDRVLYAYLPDAKPKNWLNHLYQIRNLKFENLYMSHVRPIGNRKDLDLQIQYFEDLYKATDKAMKDGTPFFEIPTKVKMPQYEHLQNYKEWLHMNVWRILMEKSIGQ